MADKSFGIKELNLIGASGTPTITSPNNLNLNASNVAISTDVTIGRHLDVDGHAEFDAVNVSGVSTFSGITTVPGPSLFTNQLSVSGISTFLGAINVNDSYGTSGQVLTSQGSGSAPQWATVASGGSVSGTPSGTSWSVTGITGSPDLITVSVYGYTNNVSNEWLALQLRNSSGPISSGSYSSTVRQNGGSAVLNANTIYWVLLDQSHTNSSTAVLNGNITLARSATNQWTASWILYQENSSGSVTTGAGRFTATTGGSITGIQILSGSNHNGTFSATF